ncbi:hypothetical protein KY382_35485, partial [Pseudomonas monteilii]|nr:hypothetical protein [Pseudomonas monteilii]
TPDLFLTKEQLPENYQIVGPIFAKLGSSLPDEVLTFIQQKRRERKRIVYFAMGSSGNPRMVRKILAFLRNRSELAIIAPVTHLLKGKHNDSENLFLTEYLPSHLSISIFLLSMVGKGLFKQLVHLGSRLSELGCTMSNAAIFSTA